MSYCLDTNTIVFCLRGKSARVLNRIRSTPPHEIRVPMHVLAELHVGATKSAKPIEKKQAIDAFIEPFALLWPNEAVIAHYASIRCALEAMGKVIGEADLWIAATARAAGDVLVTNNVDEFQRVPDLLVEDWSL